MVQANPRQIEEIDFAELLSKLANEFRSQVQNDQEETKEESKSVSNKAVKVGRALSQVHARKMAQHAVIAPVMTKQQRLKAVGTI